MKLSITPVIDYTYVFGAGDGSGFTDSQLKPGYGECLEHNLCYSLGHRFYQKKFLAFDKLD